MSELLKNLLMWLFIAITVFSVFNNFSTEESNQELSYSEFISQVESDQVLSVEFSSDNYTLKGKTCLLYTSPSPRDRTRSRMPSSA